MIQFNHIANEDSRCRQLNNNRLPHYYYISYCIIVFNCILMVKYVKVGDHLVQQCNTGCSVRNVWKDWMSSRSNSKLRPEVERYISKMNEQRQKLIERVERKEENLHEFPNFLSSIDLNDLVLWIVQYFNI